MLVRAYSCDGGFTIKSGSAFGGVGGGSASSAGGVARREGRNGFRRCGRPGGALWLRVLDRRGPGRMVRRCGDRRDLLRKRERVRRRPSRERAREARDVR